MSKKIHMWKSLSLIVLCAGFFSLAVHDASAAAYIKFDGIDGEATDDVHKDWINLVSFDHFFRSVVDDGSVSQRRRKVALGDITCVKELDKSSPKIAEILLTSTVIPEVTIELTRRSPEGSQTTYLTYELKNVIITSYQIQASGDDATVPVEEISLNFEEIKVTYTTSDNSGQATGNVEYSWKVEEGES